MPGIFSASFKFSSVIFSGPVTTINFTLSSIAFFIISCLSPTIRMLLEFKFTLLINVSLSYDATSTLPFISSSNGN